jgi:hypothetical protein
MSAHPALQDAFISAESKHEHKSEIKEHQEATSKGFKTLFHEPINTKLRSKYLKLVQPLFR